LTIASRRRQTASARASLPLPAAPDAQRSAASAAREAKKEDSRGSRERVLRCKEIAMSAHIGGVHDARRHPRDRRAEVIRWLSTVGCMIILTLLLVPLAAEVQPPPNVPRIGVLSSSSPTAASRNHAAFR